MNKKYSIFTLFILFGISGFSGLIYESIWTHYLKLFLGHASYSQVLVLVMFMGGMAIGAWGIGHFSSKIKNLLLGYALVEALIGILGILFHTAFVNIIDVSFNTIIPNIDSPSLITLYKWVLAGLLILPQSILLGTTFPLMTGSILRRNIKSPGKSIANLYFINSLGASIGVLISGFFLIKKVGLPGTITIAGLLNIILAVTIWALFRKTDENQSSTPTPIIDSNQIGINKMLLFLFLLCAFLTGTSSFMYEIAWIRMLSLVLGSSTHAFELMLSAFIFGLAIGGFWIKNRIDKLKNLIATLAIVQIFMGLLAVGTLLIYDKLFDFMAFIISGLNRSEAGYIFFSLLSHLICLIIMLPPTICAGMTLPLITHFLLKKKHGESSIGKVYGINTLGAIIGVILSIQLILPLWGLKPLMIIAGAIDIIIGIILLLKSNIIQVKKKATISFIAISIIIIFSISFYKLDYKKMASGVFRHGNKNIRGEIIFHKDGKAATIDVIKDKELFSILTNGKPDGSITKSNDKKKIVMSDESGQSLLSIIPISINLKAKKVASIGLGTGMTSSIVLRNPHIEKLDIIEIEEAMVEGAKLLNFRNSNIYNNKRSKIIIEDAKTYFSSNKKIYDLIISVPSNPWVSGVSSLFSKEFYKLIKRHISKDGVFVQWFQKYEMNLTLFSSVINALSKEFKYYTLYIANDTDIIIVGSHSKKINDPNSKIFEIEELKAQLSRINIYNIDDIKAMKLGDEESLNDFFLSFNTNPNSDYYPILDNNSEKSRFLSESINEFDTLLSLDIPLLSSFDDNYFYPESENISPKSYNLKSVKICQAINIMKYFRNLSSNFQEQHSLSANIDKDIKYHISSLLQISKKTNFTDKHKYEAIWLNNLWYLMKSTINYLSPKQMNVILKTLDSITHHNQDFSLNISEELQKWIYLYKALSSRNFIKVKEISSDLLSNKKYDNIKPAKSTLFLSLILSEIKLNKLKEALDTIKKSESFYKKKPISLQFLKVKLYSKAKKTYN